jgi:glycosyltransferase involved in cell wall biosynthesis
MAAEIKGNRFCAPNKMQVSNQPLISIVVAAYTEKRLSDILKLIESIDSQRYSKIEVIFVIEKSGKLFSSIKNRLPDAKVLFFEESLGITKARNIGSDIATGQIVAFVDDDAILFPDWASELVSTFVDNENVVGVTGPAFPLWQDESMTWFPEEFYWIIGCTGWKGISNETDVNYAAGVNMAFLKSVFNICKFLDGYSQGAHDKGKMGPLSDDRDFSLKVRTKTGKRILYNPSVKVWHVIPLHKLSSRYITRSAYWQGYSDAMSSRTMQAWATMSGASFHVLSRIASQLFPSIIRDLNSNRGRALKKIKTTIEVLIYFPLGYLSYLLKAHFDTK